MNDQKRGKPFLDLLRTLFKNRASEKLLAGITRGKKWDSVVARIPPNYYQYEPGSMRRAVRDGFIFDLDLNEYMQWLIYFGIVAEPRSALYDLVKPGMTVLDVGANIGETSLHFSRLAGAKGSVHAFEPFPATFYKLDHHARINKCENIHVHNIALSDKPGVLFMTDTPGNSGGNRTNFSEGNIKVPAETLDSFLVRYPNCKPDLIKIDVEGFESNVLLGASETLKKHKPVLFLEVNDLFLNRAGSSANELFSILNSHGYSIVNAADGKKIQAANELSIGHLDVIAK